MKQNISRTTRNKLKSFSLTYFAVLHVILYVKCRPKFRCITVNYSVFLAMPKSKNDRRQDFV